MIEINPVPTDSRPGASETTDTEWCVHARKCETQLEVFHRIFGASPSTVTPVIQGKNSCIDRHFTNRSTVDFDEVHVHK